MNEFAVIKFFQDQEAIQFEKVRDLKGLVDALPVLKDSLYSQVITQLMTIPPQERSQHFKRLVNLESFKFLSLLKSRDFKVFLYQLSLDE